MVQILTVEGVKKAARRYYRMGKLTAQHPRKDKRLCSYKVGEYRCAIGAALNVSTLKNIESRHLNDGFSAEVLVSKKIIRTRSIKTLLKLQNLHDNWASISSFYGYRSRADDEKGKFLKAIGLKK